MLIPYTLPAPAAPAAAGVRLTNRTRGTVLAERGDVARGFLARLVGLIGRRHLAPGEALLFPGTPWVHSWGMRFPIDLVFYGAGWEVLAVVEGLRPWRVAPPCWGARGVAELPAGTVGRTGTRPGDRLEVQTAPEG